MPQIPVTKPYFDKEELSFIEDTLNSGWVAQGSKVAGFEKQIAYHENIAEGVATTSCTAALHLAMITEGLGVGMDAIAPAFTFVATENAIVMTGATPVMVDIKKETFNIDIVALEDMIENNYTKKDGALINIVTGNRLWGIVPVHEFGLCCDIVRVNEVAKRNNLVVVEDAACALGAKVGKTHQGAFGNMSCVSFHPRKSITTGEGGMVLTDDLSKAKRMRELRAHGCTISADVRNKGKGFLLPEFNEAGFNYRMTDIQGAMGLAQVKKFDYIISEKRRRAKLYDEMIRHELPELIPPTEPKGYFHTYQSYVCILDLDRLGLTRIDEGGKFRNILLQRLEDRGIATRQGTHAVHTLGYYRNRFGYKPMDFPQAYACDQLSITIPLYVQMTDTEQKNVIKAMREELDNLKQEL